MTKEYMDEEELKKILELAKGVKNIEGELDRIKGERKFYDKWREKLTRREAEMNEEYLKGDQRYREEWDAREARARDKIFEQDSTDATFDLILKRLEGLERRVKELEDARPKEK